MQLDQNTIRYTLTRSDLLAFQTRTLVRNRGLLVLSSLCFLAIVILSVKHPNDQQASFAFHLVVAIAMALILTTFVGMVSYLFLIISVWTGQHHNILLEHTVTLTPTGIESKSENGEGFLKWSGVYKVVSTKRLLIIFFNQTTARIIPKRCFPTTEGAMAFEQTIRSNLPRT